MDIRLPTLEMMGDTTSKVVIVRVDFNVPLSGGAVSDVSRIEAAVPTIEFLRGEGAKIVLLSHLGRPNGVKSDEFSLVQITEAISDVLGFPVQFCEDCIGEVVQSAIATMHPGQILLCENVRFYAEEKENDQSFAKSLAECADFYVNDAFSAAHRAHASTAAITKERPSYAGRLIEKEVAALTDALEAPEKPAVAVVGGAKISTKLSVLHNIVRKVDYLVLGGGMANTFLKAKGHNIGQSLCEDDMLDEAKDIMDVADQNGCQVILPEFVVVAEQLKDAQVVRDIHINDIEDHESIFDAGKVSSDEINAIMSESKTVLWNGPLGVFEISPFENGTNTVAQCVGDLTEKGQVVSVAGGGDTVSALNKAGVLQQFSYISTAGGAFLEWLEGKDLPALVLLTESYDLINNTCPQKK